MLKPRLPQNRIIYQVKNIRVIEKQPKSIKDEKENTLKNIRDIVFIVAIYLYFIGYVYIYNYLNYFGISIKEAGVEFYDFIVFSSTAVSHFFIYPNELYYSIPTIIFFILAYLFIKRKKIKITYILLIILAILSFFIGSYAGLQDAVIQEKESSDLKTIKFIFKPREKFNDEDHYRQDSAFLSFNAANQLKLITANDSSFFVIWKDGAADHIVYIIPKESILLTKIYQ